MMTKIQVSLVTGSRSFRDNAPAKTTSSTINQRIVRNIMGFGGKLEIPGWQRKYKGFMVMALIFISPIPKNFVPIRAIRVFMSA